MKAELSNFVQDCYDHEEMRQLDDVYVTDHKPVDKKYLTGSEEEDQDFFDYQQSIDDYNNDDS